MFDAIKAAFSKAAKGGKRPNIIVVLLDQFRTDALSSHPVFADIRNRGVFFSNVITYAPYTLASCHATFTGMYGRDNGVDAYTKSDRYDSKHCYSIADYLSSVGYYTAAYTFSPILIPHSGIKRFRLVPEDEEQDIVMSHGEEIRHCFGQQEPFFLFLHHGEIHHEIVKEVINKYHYSDEDYFSEGARELNKKRYQAYTKEAGEYLDAIIKIIDECDSDENTMVVVMTDHGGSNGEKVGEKAYGSFTYDYSIRVWYYLLWSRQFVANTEIKTQVRTIDILPTILDIVGISHNKNKKPVMGRSVLNLINGEDEEHRMSFSETGGVDGPYPSPDEPNVRCVRDGNWKLIQNITTNKFELYDLNSDPEEANNLYGQEPDHAERLWFEMVKYI